MHAKTNAWWYLQNTNMYKWEILMPRVSVFLWSSSYRESIFEQYHLSVWYSTTGRLQELCRLQASKSTLHEAWEISTCVLSTEAAPSPCSTRVGFKFKTEIFDNEYTYSASDPLNLLTFCNYCTDLYIKWTLRVLCICTTSMQGRRCSLGKLGDRQEC